MSVQQTINQQASGGEIVEVKREDDPDGRRNYEVVVRTSWKEWGFEVDPGVGILLVPMGAVLLLTTAFQIGWSAVREAFQINKKKLDSAYNFVIITASNSLTRKIQP